LINAEVAQQTSNTPLAFQHENTAPQEYFQRLIESFEERMYLYRRQVEEVESHLASLQQPQSVSPQGIFIIFLSSGDVSSTLHLKHFVILFCFFRNFCCDEKTTRNFHNFSSSDARNS
jgi:hypothetical protein